jgi:ClpP class serine protease
MDGFWGALPYLLLILVFFLLPAMARRRHGAEVERQFTRIQRKRKSRVIAIVHRQEPMGLLGFAQLRYIDLNDSEDVLNAIRNTPAERPIDLVLHTPGGLVLPALQIARALKAHPARKTVYVPHYAMSGGTLIALAADEIILSEHAVLGPIDPQIAGLPASSIAHVVAQKSPDATEDYTLILADVARKAEAQLERAAQDLLRGTVSDNAVKAVAEQLSSGRWTHDYPIVAEEAAAMGLNVSTAMPQDIMDLMALFPDRASRRSVQFSDSALNPFGRRRRASRPPQQTLAPPAAERVPFTGYQPGPGARSFSYGPWNAEDLVRRSDGPGRGETRPSRR